MPAGDKIYMEPLELAGQIIMENGGETYRAEETVTRMGRAFGLREVETFAVPSGLFISFRRADGSSETSVKRMRRSGTNLERVDEANRVSREVEAGLLTVGQATERLRTIQRMHGAVRSGTAVLAAALCGAGFTALFGGGWLDVLISCCAAALVQQLSLALERYRARSLVYTLIGSFITALAPMLASLVFAEVHADPIIGGALMPMLPGLAMTNAVQDTMRGDMVSGLSHGVEAILTASLVAGGALAASWLFGLTGGSVG